MKHLNILFLIMLFNHFSLAQKESSSFTAKAKYSNKQVVWYEYAYWLDGTLLGDKKNNDKFNDILFKKVGNKYYKAQIEGAFNAKDWGIKDEYEKGNPKENSIRIQEMLDYFPLGYTASIYIPTGQYYFSNTIIIDARPVRLFGDNGTPFTPYGTRLHFSKETIGIAILRNAANYQETIIENLCLYGGNNKKEWMDGIMMRGRCTLRNISVKGFYNGIEGYGAMEEKNDISGSLIEKCYAAENTNDGFFLGRTDGSSITITACDARDNGRYGYNDDSFLGNNFISCMAHYNKAGDYFVRDKANARSMFLACYSEGGNKVSQLGPLSTIVGGIWGTGYSKDGKTVLK